MAHDGQRETTRRQGETLDAVEILVIRCDQLATAGAQPANHVVDNDERVAVSREDETTAFTVGKRRVDRILLEARGSVIYAKLLKTIHERCQPPVRRQG